MGAAFVLYAQGLLPFLLPLSILIFEPDVRSRRRMLPFAISVASPRCICFGASPPIRSGFTSKHNSIVYINDATNHTALAILYVISTCGSLFFSQRPPHDHFRRNEPRDPALH